MTKKKSLSDLEKDTAKKNMNIPDTDVLVETLMNASPIGIGFLVNRTILRVNNSLCELLGYSSEEIIGENSRFLYPSQEEYDRVGLIKYKSIKSKGSGSLKTTFIKKDGSLIDIFLSSTAIDKDNLERGLVFTVTDLTNLESAHKKASDSLVKYETFFNSVVDALFLHPLDLEGYANFIEVNDAACIKYGYSREEFLKLKVPDITHSKVIMERFKKKVQAKSSKGESTIFETVHVKKSGEKFPVEINANILEIGGTKYIMSVVRDISERVMVRKEAEANEALSKNIIQTALDGFLSITLEGVIVDANESYCSMVDYTREELVGISVTKRVAGLDPKEIKEIIGSIIKTGYGSFRIGHKRRDGNIVDMQVNARRLDMGGGRIVAFLKDITQSNAEELILQTRIDLMTNSPERSMDNILQESLDRAEELTRSKISFFHFLDPDQKTLTLQMWSTNTLNNMCSAEGKGSHYNIDKAGIWVEAVREKKPVIHNDYNSLKNKRGLPEGHAPIIRELVVPIFRGAEIVAIIGVGNKKVGYTDQDIEIVTRLGDIAWSIYERKIAEIDLIAAKEKAEESDKLKSTFLATMSHELRTPLNAVIGFSNLISEGEDIDSIHKMNEYVLESGNRLLKIIESIFEISMLETKNAGLIKEEFTASEFFSSISYTIRAELVKENKTHLKILFKPDSGNGDYHLYSDRTKLTQLITNLVNNAIKYTEKGTISYGYKVNKGEVVFFVEDTGIGIPAEKLGIIFDKFRQVDETHTRSHSGVGLGLAICKEISTLLNGKLWVDSEQGKGSKFYFSADILITSKEKEKDSPIKKIPDFKGKTILIAEDVESNYLYLEKVLEKSNATIIWALNGNEAIDAVKNNRNIDLVLMDIRMPGLNGYEATALIKEIRETLPVVAQTAYAMTDDKDRAIESGCDDYLSKPIKMGTLYAILNKYLA